MAKNIVLLSDGTGNSAGKLFKTNVWRIYESLDLRDPARQVACYDDGVGTSTFLPLAVLGGALGFGLKRNVLRLYRFLCEHYEPGDRIYAFGFSRGAFTIRVLVALICDQGVIRARAARPPVLAAAGPEAVGIAGAVAEAPAAVAEAVGAAAGEAPASPEDQRVANGTELRRETKRAYRHFRRLFNQRLPLVYAASLVRRAVERLGRRTPYDPSRNVPVEAITFVGLWDTVDAYGLPIDELTTGVDRWIWPLSFPELELAATVKKACHALSLDDERHTFHPVLWDESRERQDAAHLDEERVSQVWFAGVHANVGGGYPNDALSGVSLDWMAVEARKQGLLFVPDLITTATARHDPLGTLYDSRRGLAVYYRYNPRKVEYLTNGQVHEQGFFGYPTPSPTVRIDRPKIHESVFTRIENAPDAYAPIGLPARYAVVKANGSIVEGEANPFEAPAVARQRAAAQEMLWNLVWYRRIVYFASVGCSVVLALLPFRDGVDLAALEPRGDASRAINVVGSFLPDLASPWLDYYAAQPLHLVLGSLVLGAAMLIGRGLQSQIGNGMRKLWTDALEADNGAAVLPAPHGVLYRIRQHPYYHASFAVFRHTLLPHAFGLFVLMCLIAAGNRVLFEAANLAGLPCERSSSRTVLAPGSTAAYTYSTADFCAATGVGLDAGARYRVALSFTGVRDGGIDVATPAGVGITSANLAFGQRVAFFLGTPFKRVWRANWFVPVARVGNRGTTEQVLLNAAITEFTARNTGELFLFVNDAIAPLAYLPGGLGARAGWAGFYGNNDGTVTVSIERLGDGRSSRADGRSAPSPP